MSPYEAMVRLRVEQIKDPDARPIDYIIMIAGDPDHGVLVLNVDAPTGHPYKYRAMIHVRVTQPTKFWPIEPKDYLRINLTDEDFGVVVEDVRILPPKGN